MQGRVQELGAQIRSRLADAGASWLSEIGHPDPESVLSRLPERVLLERDPLRVLQLLRDLSAQAGDHRVAVGTARAVVGLTRDHPDGAVELGALGALLERVGAADEGLPMLASAVRQLEARGRDLRLAVVAQNLGAGLVRQGNWQAALPQLQTAVSIRRALAPDTAGLALAQLGELLQKLGRTAEAVPLLAEAHALAVRTEGPTAQRTLARAHVLGTAYNAAERYADAARVLRPVFENLGPQDPERRAQIAFELGVALDRSGAEEEAVRRIDESLRLTRQLRPGNTAPHEALPNRLAMMAQLHGRRGRGAEAEGLLLEALHTTGQLFGEDSPEAAAMTAQLGHFCYRMGRPDEAVGWMDTATSLVETALGADHPQTVAVADAHTALLLEVATHQWTVDPAQARGLAERAFEVSSRLLGHSHARTRAARDLLARPQRR